MKLPKVLIGVCTYEGKDYVWKDFKKNLESLTYPNYDVLIVDNSKSGKYAKRISKECSFQVKHLPRAVNTRIGHADSLNHIRSVALAKGYDYVLFIESDLLPPVDIIQRLITTGKDVVGSLYYIGHAWDKKRLPRPCVFLRKEKTTRQLEESEAGDYFNKGVVRVHGCGLGTTLVHKSVLEQFAFWYNLSDPPKHSDVLFFMDLENDKVPVYVNTDLIVPHFPSDWDLVKDI